MEGAKGKGTLRRAILVTDPGGQRRTWPMPRLVEPMTLTITTLEKLMRFFMGVAGAAPAASLRALRSSALPPFTEPPLRGCRRRLPTLPRGPGLRRAVLAAPVVAAAAVAAPGRLPHPSAGTGRSVHMRRSSTSPPTPPLPAPSLPPPLLVPASPPPS